MQEPQLTTAYECDDFWIAYEQYGPLKVMHSMVERWSPSIRRQYHEACEQVFKELDEPLFVVEYIGGQQKPTFLKFVRSLRFTPYASSEYWGYPVIFHVKVN